MPNTTARLSCGARGETTSNCELLPRPSALGPSRLKDYDDTAYNSSSTSYLADMDVTQTGGRWVTACIFGTHDAPRTHRYILSRTKRIRARSTTETSKTVEIPCLSHPRLGCSRISPAVDVRSYYCIMNEIEHRVSQHSITNGRLCHVD